MVYCKYVHSCSSDKDALPTYLIADAFFLLFLIFSKYLFIFIKFLSILFFNELKPKCFCTPNIYCNKQIGCYALTEDLLNFFCFNCVVLDHYTLILYSIF